EADGGHQQDGSTRELAFGREGREHQLCLAVDAGGLLAETADDVGAVEAEIVGIAAHEADRVGGAREIAEAGVLNRLQVGEADWRRSAARGRGARASGASAHPRRYRPDRR